MIYPPPISFLPPPATGPTKKKRVLLVDSVPDKRDRRAEAMRRLGMEVDCAADVSEARSWWRADLYNLVLISVGNELGRRDKFCEDMRSAVPPQHFAFLVGKPEYLASEPNVEQELSRLAGADVILASEATAMHLSDPFGDPPRWGFVEALRQISAVRLAFQARSKAIRERPAPPRDSDGTSSKRATQSKTLDQLLRKEMQ